MAALRRLLLGLMLIFAGALVTPSPSIEPHSPIDIVVDTLAPQAQAITSSQRALLRRGISPVASWDASTGTLTSLAALVTATRTSNATMFDSTGKLTYGPNNLLTYSNTFSNAAWTKQNVTLSNANAVSDPFGGTDATTVTATAGGTTAQLYQSMAATPAPNVMQAIWVKRRTGSGAITLVINGSSKTLAVNGSWQFLSGYAAPGSGPYYFQLTFATNGDAVDIYAASNALVTYETTPRTADQVITTSAAYYGPRVDWSDGTPALLIERTKTNYFTNSENAASWSWLSNVTASSAANSLYGGVSLSTLTVSAGGGPAAGQGPYVSVVSGDIYTFTVALVAGTRTTGFIGVYGNSSTWGLDANATATVLSGPGSVARNTGALWDVSGLTSTPTLIKLTRTSAATEHFTPFVYVYTSGAVVGQTLKVGRPQFEAGSVQTSYIPCGASATTRAPDTLGLAGGALTAGQGAQGTIIAEFAGLNPVSMSYQMGFIGSNANGLAYQNLGDTTMYSYNGTSALSYSSFDAVKPAARVVFAWTASTRALASAGVLVKDNAIPWPSAPSSIYLGHLAAGNQVDARLKSFAIYNQRLPDATLQAKSVVGAW